MHSHVKLLKLTTRGWVWLKLPKSAIRGLSQIMPKLVPRGCIYHFFQKLATRGAPVQSCQERLPPFSLNMIPKLATRGCSWALSRGRGCCLACLLKQAIRGGIVSENGRQRVLQSPAAQIGHQGALQANLPKLATRGHS